MFGKFGINNPNFGRKNGADTIELMRKSAYRLGKFGSNNPSSKKYKVTHPNGDIEIIIGLPEFCKQYNLYSSAMTMCAKGRNKTHKGFRCEYAD
jgi:hypothetical protein